MSLLKTKGWHNDVTDDQIALAQEVLKTINKSRCYIHYAECKDPLFGRREFWIDLPPHDLDPKKVIAAFDMHGNFVIYQSFLESCAEK